MNPHNTPEKLWYTMPIIDCYDNKKVVSRNSSSSPRELDLSPTRRTSGRTNIPTEVPL